MKLSVIVLLCICYFCLVESAPNVQPKGNISHESCPHNTKEACVAYVEEKAKVAKKEGRCESVTGTDLITYSSCGCPQGSIPTKQDLSKPFPDCCPRNCVLNENLQILLNYTPVPNARDKRAVGLGQCPYNTDKECIEFVEIQREKAKVNGDCASIEGVKNITYYSCGTNRCRKGSVPEEPNKSLPYPDCCSRKCIPKDIG